MSSSPERQVWRNLEERRTDRNTEAERFSVGRVVVCGKGVCAERVCPSCGEGKSNSNSRALRFGIRANIEAVRISLLIHAYSSGGGHIERLNVCRYKKGLGKPKRKKDIFLS